MNENNINSNLVSNLQSFTEADNNNISDEKNDDAKSEAKETNIKNKKKLTSKSQKKIKKKKKRKKNRHIRILCRDKIEQKSLPEIKVKSRVKSATPKRTNLDNYGEKVLTKSYLAKLFQKKKMYSEKVKLIKLFKKSEKASKENNNSCLDLIKKYSKKVRIANEEVIKVQKEREKEREKEIEKEIIELFGIQKSQILSSRDIINKNNFKKELPSLGVMKELKEISKPIRNILNANDFNHYNLQNFSSRNKNNSNKRYFFSELKKLDSSIHEERSILKESSNLNSNNKSYKSTFNLKIQLNNSSNKEKEKKLIKSIKVEKVNPIKINEGNTEIIANDKDSNRAKMKQRLKDFNSLHYLILPGNASYLVKNCMCHRTNWKEQFRYINYYNFRWQQLSYGINYTNLGKFGAMKQVVNHYENHYAISNKANMFINLMYYCEQRKMSVFKYVPFTIIFDLNFGEKEKNKEKQEYHQEQLEKLKKFIEETQKFVVKYEDIGKYFNDQRFQEEKKKRNEFYFDAYISKKIKEKKKKIKLDDFDDDKNKFNGGYLVYRDYFKRLKLIENVSTVYENNMERYEKDKVMAKKMEQAIGTNTLIEIPDTHYRGRNMWVIKAINLNRGMCIQIVNNYNQMMAVLNKFREGVNYDFTEKIIEEEDSKNNDKDDNKDTGEQKDKDPNKNEESKNNEEKNDDKDANNNEEDKKKDKPMYYCSKIIIQKYIENPLLYKGRKCDMRVWVLLTHNMKVYFFKEGHLKTCSIEYDINSKDAFRHITNYSFQKYNDNFQKYEKGNEVPFYEFQKFLDENYAEKNYKLNKDLSKQIKEIVSITMKSGKEQINKNGRNFQFEIFGYDFMLDENFNLFLIEINSNPGIEESSPWIKVIIPRMLDDALRLTLDQIFNPGYDFSKIYKNEEEETNMKIVLNNLKNKIDPNAPNPLIDEINKKDEANKISQTCLTDNNNSTNLNETEKEGEKEGEKEKEDKDTKINNNKNSKYKTPFPVPGYEEDENLWEFVCDLNHKDPLDNYLDKEENSSQDSFTGIKYLYNKRKNNKENKNEKANENNILNKNVSEIQKENKEKEKDKDKETSETKDNKVPEIMVKKEKGEINIQQV